MQLFDTFGHCDLHPLSLRPFSLPFLSLPWFCEPFEPFNVHWVQCWLLGTKALVKCKLKHCITFDSLTSDNFVSWHAAKYKWEESNSFPRENKLARIKQKQAKKGERPERISTSISQRRGGLSIIGKGKLMIFLDDASKPSPFHKDPVVPKRRLVLCVLFYQIEFSFFL